MKKIVIIFSVIICILACVGCFVFVKYQKDNTNNTAAIQSEIDNYQQKYFEIIKRHNALLVLENNEDATEDLKELKGLFIEVKDKINKENEFLFEYEKIKEIYKVNMGQNTLEMNEFASNKFKAFDELLNKVYEDIKSKLKEEEFEQLKLSQRAWLKEVDDYNTVFKAQGFGTIGTLVKLDYETNMYCFRTLLLMLYLN